MKKKMYTYLLIGAMVSASMVGCAKKDEPEAPAAVETEAEAPKEEEPEEPEEVSETEYLLSIMGENEDGSFEACDKDQNSYTLVLADTFPEEQKELLSVDAVLKVKAPEGSEEELEDGKKLTITSAEAVVESEETLELNKAAFEKVNGFSVDNTVVATMYAKQQVNTRKGPSTDYEKVGGLSFAQEVNVTGMADTGWYQIDYEDGKAYVSNKYLATEKPVAQVASNNGGGSAGGGAGASGSSSGEENFYVVYSKEEMDAAKARRDVNAVFKMMEANAAATMGTGGGSSSSGGGSAATASNEKSTSSSRDFLNYINSKREAEGIPTLSWDDGLASIAKERAEELVGDYSHSGMRGCMTEIIQRTSSSSVSSWFDAFYASSNHRMDMMDDLYTKAAAAVCQTGNTYYVIVMFDF